MKTVGLLGGLGPESTVEYYRQIISSYREQRPDGSYPSIIIDSIDVNKVLKLAGALQHTELADYLVEEIARLAGAGADFGAITANTPHVVFEDVSRRSPIPLLSIVEAARNAALAGSLNRLALFGTHMTMRARFYADIFSRSGLTVVTPSSADQEYIHKKYVTELLAGVVLPETRSSLLSIIDRMREEVAIEGVILAGTELPLILREPTYNGIPLLDTTRIHVEAIVAHLLAE